MNEITEALELECHGTLVAITNLLSAEKGTLPGYLVASLSQAAHDLDVMLDRAAANANR